MDVGNGQWWEEHVLPCFPPGIRFGFAYGSGVFEQRDCGNASTAGETLPMVDCVFAVDDAEAWRLTLDPVQADRDARTPDHHACAASDQRGAPDDVQARYAIDSGEAPDCERPAEAPAETWRTWRLTRPSGFRTRSRTESVCFLRDHRFGLRPPLTR